ncbi:MAG TPA: GH32 C-terminal domain-containing protein, partial [Segetibacter sp.]
VAELKALEETSKNVENINAANYNFTKEVGAISGPFQLRLSADSIKDFSFSFSNKLGEKVVVGYSKAGNNYYIDRTKSGKVDFEKSFAARHTAPRFSTKQNFNCIMVVDNASIELFADDGLSTMTEIFFPNEIFSTIHVQSPDNFTIKSLQITRYKSIWK